MRYLGYLAVFMGIALCGVGCGEFGQFLFGDGDSSGAVGTLESGAGIAAAAGVPWAGVAKVGLGLLGAVGGFFTGRKGKNGNARSFVKLLDEVKAKAGDLKNDADLERVILDYAKKDPRFGGYLARIHASLKGKR